MSVPDAIRARHRTTPDKLTTVSTGIPPDILQEAARRVGIGALALAAVWLLGLFVIYVLVPIGAPQEEAPSPERTILLTAVESNRTG